MHIPGADKAIDNLMKWSANEEWNPFREQVFAEHFDMIFDRFDTTKEEIADLLSQAICSSVCVDGSFTDGAGATGEGCTSGSRSVGMATVSIGGGACAGLRGLSPSGPAGWMRPSG